jgi:predicted O-methyltransferase YrrM
MDIPDMDVLIGRKVSVTPGVRNGRNVLEGYQRGWGLQFGGLREKITAERLFRHAVDNSTIQSWVSVPNRANIYLILTRFLPALGSQDIVEFGTFKGGNAIFMALVLKEVAPRAKIYALDTYEGMPETDKTIDAHSKNEFSEASLDAFRDEIDRLKLSNLIPIKGLFQDTFPKLEGPFGFAHVDCDIYSAVKYSQDAVWPKMCVGGYIAYDDACVSSCLGATQAVEELIQERGIHSEQIYPHFVFRSHLSP